MKRFLETFNRGIDVVIPLCAALVICDVFLACSSAFTWLKPAELFVRIATCLGGIYFAGRASEKV